MMLGPTNFDVAVFDQLTFRVHLLLICFIILSNNNMLARHQLANKVVKKSDPGSTCRNFWKNKCRNLKEGLGQTIMPWLGRYSLTRMWLIGKGNSPETSYTFCVIFFSQGGTEGQRKRESHFYTLPVPQNILSFNNRTVHRITLNRGNSEKIYLHHFFFPRTRWCTSLITFTGILTSKLSKSNKFVMQICYLRLTFFSFFILKITKKQDYPMIWML